jgi:hypothetical protein
VLGQPIRIGWLRLDLLAERPALQAIFETGAGHQYVFHTRLDHAFDKAVVGHQVVLEMEQPPIVRQPRPCQMRQHIDALGQCDDIDIGGVNIRRDKLDVLDPRHALRSVCVARHRTHRAPRANSAATRCRPTKPVAPVTRTFTARSTQARRSRSDRPTDALAPVAG